MVGHVTASYKPMQKSISVDHDGLSTPISIIELLGIIGNYKIKLDLPVEV